ncbi:hypothetical protein ACFVZZ_14640 [Streptomyces chartreusis]|uniref:hypothetical protein n=1 Tax=Streptomyces chartreusis TaxID=1969 RepID=UPI0036DB5892
MTGLEDSLAVGDEPLLLAWRLVGPGSPDGLSAYAGLVLFYEKTGQAEEATPSDPLLSRQSSG